MTQPEYTVEVTISRIGPREFELSVDARSIPDELPADMADWLEREHGVRAAEHGVDVVPTEDWPPGEGSPPEQAGPGGD